ncbi:MAG: hypothetical protein K8I82_05060, partial [Anaerolineae bacterium]|nr:hypothetical protein [Anaerolineae bacterium]
VVDGDPLDEFTCTDFWDSPLPLLSSDGEHLIYPCLNSAPDADERALLIVADGVQYGPYLNVWGTGFSSNGQHFAYAASDKQGEWAFYGNGEAFLPRYKNVYPPHLSSDGAYIAWTGIRDDHMILAVNGQEIDTVTPTDVLWGPQFDEDRGQVHWVIMSEDRILRIRVTLG